MLSPDSSANSCIMVPSLHDSTILPGFALFLNFVFLLYGEKILSKKALVFVILSTCLSKPLRIARKQSSMPPPSCSKKSLGVTIDSFKILSAPPMIPDLSVFLPLLAILSLSTSIVFSASSEIVALISSLNALL